MTIYYRDKNKSFFSIFALVSCVVLALPCLALGAGHTGGGSGGFHASSGGLHVGAGGFHVSRPFGRQAALHGFHRRGFFDADGFFDGDGGVITVEQPEPAAMIEPQQPVHKGRYVQPRWVDAGHGVQVSEPGYWTDK